MISKICRRNWLSPMVGIFFVAVGVSGVSMLFHLEIGALRVMHEWIGLAFVIAATLHLLLNVRPLLAHFKTRGALFAMGVSAVLCGGFALAGSHADADGHARHGHRHGSR